MLDNGGGTCKLGLASQPVSVRCSTQHAIATFFGRFAGLQQLTKGPTISRSMVNGALVQSSILLMIILWSSFQANLVLVRLATFSDLFWDAALSLDGG